MYQHVGGELDASLKHNVLKPARWRLHGVQCPSAPSVFAARKRPASNPSSLIPLTEVQIVAESFSVFWGVKVECVEVGAGIDASALSLPLLLLSDGL